MKLLRTRRPSVKTMLGVTKAKKRLYTATGITAIKKPFRAPKNFKAKINRRTGYYSKPMKWLRFFGRMFKKGSR